MHIYRHIHSIIYTHFLCFYVIIIITIFIINTHTCTCFKYEVARATAPTKKLKATYLYTQKIGFYLPAAFHYFTEVKTDKSFYYFILFPPPTPLKKKTIAMSCGLL